METIENLSIQLAEVLDQKEQLMKQETELKNNIMSYMKLNKKVFVDSELLVFRYRDTNSRRVFDIDKLSKTYPDIFEDSKMWKKTKVKPCLVVNRKVVKK